MHGFDDLYRRLTDNGNDFRLLAVLLSVPLFLYAALSEPLLNQDAFHYLRAAELIMERGLTVTLGEYGWHGYSLIIAQLDRLLPGDGIAAARLLNLACYMLLVWSFITLSMAFRQSPAISLLAALSILIFPNLSEFRNHIIRDFGYWAFALTGLVALIRCHKQPVLSTVLVFALIMLCALLFRPETLVLMGLAPLSFLFNRQLSLSKRLRYGLAFILIPLLLLLLAAGVMSLAGLSAGELFQHAWRHYLPRILDYRAVITESVAAVNDALFLETFFPGHGPIGMIALLVTYLLTVVINILRELPPLIVLLLGWGLWLRAYQCDHQGRVAMIPAFTFILGVALYLFVFLSTMRFSTGRYGMLASLILLAFLPLCIERLHLRAIEAGHLTRFRWIFAVLLLFYVIDSLISFGYSKQYIMDAAAWVRESPHGESRLLTNDRNIAYRSGMVPAYDRIDPDPALLADDPPVDGLLVLELSHREELIVEALAENPSLEEMAVFANERGDQVRIYRAQP